MSKPVKHKRFALDLGGDRIAYVHGDPNMTAEEREALKRLLKAAAEQFEKKSDA